MMRTGALLLIPCLVVAQLATASQDLAAPERVLAVVVPSAGAYVAWLPPTEDTPDAYRVYGVAGNAWTRLNETPLLFTFVPPGYDDYAVAAVYNGIEGPAEEANDCGIHLILVPPDVNPSALLDCVRV